MKRIALAAIFSAIIIQSSFAQNFFCGSDEQNRKLFSENPEASRKHQELENFTADFISRQSASRTNPPQIIIPVVFHVIHQYGFENISDAQIFDEIATLNKTYNKQNADTALVIPDFVPLIGNIGIEFRLAQLDPNGNCTNGIDRIVSPLTYNADDNSKLNNWPSDMYLNIWVVRSIGTSGVAAYAYYPGAPDGIDGIITLSDYVGGIGTSSPTHNKVLTHEIGHYLNLSHVWGDTNSPGVACGDDHVNDTPETMGYTYCPASAAASAICNPPITENYQNYMEYSYCCHMFTAGQGQRMLATMNSFVGSRNNLWTPANLTATGVSGPPTVCLPLCDFHYDKTTICQNSTVHFYDLTSMATVSSWIWSFPGGVPSTSVDSNPVVTYPVAGDYDVTLTVTNSAGTDTKTMTSLIHVVGSGTNSAPFSEGFEDPNTFPGNGGVLVNEDNGVTWSRVSNTWSTGNNCLKINNYTNSYGEIDEWVMPPFDFTNITAPITMTFSVANAQRNGSNDKLSFYYSINCGANWQMRWAKNGAALATSGSTNASYTPTPGSSTDWRTETVNLNPLKELSNIRLKFTNTSDRGNNTYIDDINITETSVNIDEADLPTSAFAIFPNPTNTIAIIDFSLAKEQVLNASISDMSGRIVSEMNLGLLGTGNHTFSTPALPEGIYLIDLIIGNQHHVRKLVITG